MTRIIKKRVREYRSICEYCSCLFGYQLCELTHRQCDWLIEVEPSKDEYVEVDDE